MIHVDALVVATKLREIKRPRFLTRSTVEPWGFNDLWSDLVAPPRTSARQSWLQKGRSNQFHSGCAKLAKECTLSTKRLRLLFGVSSSPGNLRMSKHFKWYQRLDLRILWRLPPHIIKQIRPSERSWPWIGQTNHYSASYQSTEVLPFNRSSLPPGPGQKSTSPQSSWAHSLELNPSSWKSAWWDVEVIFTWHSLPATRKWRICPDG